MGPDGESTGDGDRPVPTETAASPAPLQLAAPWGGWLAEDLRGPVHWVDFRGPLVVDDVQAGVPIVMLHGLGGSHLNWVIACRNWPRTTGSTPSTWPGSGRRALPAGDGASQRRDGRRLRPRGRRLTGGPRRQLDGGMVSLLLTAAHPDLVEGLALVDPSIPVPRQRPDLQVAAQFALYATPFVGERYLEADPTAQRPAVLSVVDLCFADPSKADPEVIDAGVALAAHRRTVLGQAAFLGAARSLMRVLAAAGRQVPDRQHHQAGPADPRSAGPPGPRSRPLVRSQPTTPPGRPSSFLESGTPQLEVPDAVVARSRGGSRSTSLTRPQAPSAMSTAYVTCPLCEATCGLRVTPAEAIRSVRGDDEDAFPRLHLSQRRFKALQGTPTASGSRWSSAGGGGRR